MKALGNNVGIVDPETFDRLLRGIQAAVISEYKHIRYSDEIEELHRREDEGSGVLTDHPDVADGLRAAIDRSLGEFPDINESAFKNYVRDDVADQLKSLGYL